jgi:hypothetical protein
MTVERTREMLLEVLSAIEEVIPVLNYFSVDQTSADELFEALVDYNSRYDDSILCTGNLYEIKKSGLLAQIYKSILKLSYRDFEKFCVVVCRLLGFDELLVTKHSRDGGLDFLARKNPIKYNFGNHHYIVGQAKKYKKGAVTSEEIRTLIGSVTIFDRGERLHESKQHKDWHTTSHTPRSAIFMTSSFFSKDAREQCVRSGVVALDILDLVCITSDNLVNGNSLNWLKDGKLVHSRILKELNLIDEF